MPESVRIENDILEALAEDPRLPAPGEIAVEAFDGAVKLRGTVGSFAQRRAAEKDANGVRGVSAVDNELKVRLMDEYAPEDAEIRGAALQSRSCSASSASPTRSRSARRSDPTPLGCAHPARPGVRGAPDRQAARAVVSATDRSRWSDSRSSWRLRSSPTPSARPISAWLSARSPIRP